MKFDVGIVPLLNNTINRCKAAFKLKQCMSCGIPVLASKVGENKSFIKNGQGGFLFKNKKELKKYLDLFKNMEDKRYFILSQSAQE